MPKPGRHNSWFSPSKRWRKTQLMQWQGYLIALVGLAVAAVLTQWLTRKAFAGLSHMMTPVETVEKLIYKKPEWETSAFTDQYGQFLLGRDIVCLTPECRQRAPVKCKDMARRVPTVPMEVDGHVRAKTLVVYVYWEKDETYVTNINYFFKHGVAEDPYVDYLFVGEDLTWVAPATRQGVASLPAAKSNTLL